jgi:hypothetical protein
MTESVDDQQSLLDEPSCCPESNDQVVEEMQTKDSVVNDTEDNCNSDRGNGRHPADFDVSLELLVKGDLVQISEE